ncbi:hypothetical protein [Brevibacillus agri]|uniref:hypothetical protein n=1 Tax=Brevibacillus agri TaxID=51101 RepID=UPI003D1A2AF3
MAYTYSGVVELGSLLNNGTEVNRPVRPYSPTTGSNDFPGYPNGDIPIAQNGMTGWALGNTSTNAAKKLKWHALKEGNKTLLICDRVILVNVSWNDLNALGYVTGTPVVIDGRNYTLRLLTGGNYYRDSNNIHAGGVQPNEWDRFIGNEDLITGLLTPNSIDTNATLNEVDLLSAHNQMWNWAGIQTIVQERGYGGNLISLRGSASAKCFSQGSWTVSTRTSSAGWRPVLEVLNSAPSDPSGITTDKSTYTCGDPITISFTPSTDADGDAITYEADIYDATNAQWLTLATGKSGSPITATVPPMPDTSVAKVRVRARDSKGDASSNVESAAFAVQQADGIILAPVNVVSSAFLVSRMAPPVRLSNGWLVGVAKFSKAIYFFKSIDNGKNWTQLCYMDENPYNITGFSIASKGTRVYFSTAEYNTTPVGYVLAGSFEATTQANTNLSRIIADSNQRETGDVSIRITPDGTKLWWAASTKNSSYPNSFNIRAGWIPINPDGTLGTPSVVSQVTSINITGRDNKNPSITFRSDGNPVIVYDYAQTDASVAYVIRSNYFGGTVWSTHSNTYNGSTYTQFSPMTIRTPNGKLHVVWHGTDSSDTFNPYIRYSNSSDGTTWLATPRKLVKGTNASITSDKNGKLTITYEDGGYIKRIESTNEFASYQGPFVVGAGTFPASMYDPTFATDFTVPPTFFQAANAVKYYGALIVNKKPVVTLNTPDNQVLTEQATLAVSGTALDEDNGNVVTVKYKINTSAARAIASGVSDGSTPISFARTLTYSNKRLWDGAVDVAGADLAENTDHTLTVWAEDDQGGKSAEVTRKFRVVWNRPPTISGENGDLGTIIERPSITYSAVDPEGNSFTFAEYLNGQQVRSFTGEAGQEYTFQLMHDAWIRLDLDVPHQAKIVATDSAGISSERVYTFTRTEMHIEFMLDYENPEVQAFFTVDGMPNRILVTLERYLPPGAAIESVLVTNNYLDAEPTWEDATGAVVGGRGYLFRNTTKTADDWAICVWVTIAKGSADQRVHVYGYGGAFD